MSMASRRVNHKKYWCHPEKKKPGGEKSWITVGLQQTEDSRAIKRVNRMVRE